MNPVPYTGRRSHGGDSIRFVTQVDRRQGNGMELQAGIRLPSDTLDYDGQTAERAAALSAADSAPPSTVPGYQILQRIGAGKFGSVWLAREQNTGKQVAIKFYTQRRGVDWALLGREVEKLAVLYTSRHIVGLIAVGWDHDPPYYVMEYLENGSLAQRLETGPLPTSEAVRIVKRIALALVHSHGSGVLHCDIKPANVLLDQDYEPRLCDFGQSRLADERDPSLGTLFYMAPEQADLHAVPDTRWDVYALGALLYHMLVGQPPFRSDVHEAELRKCKTLQERLDTYRRIITRSPRPTLHRRVAGVDWRLADLVDRCLSVDPSRRLPNAQAVLDRLNARERHRARWPLILSGLVLPVLLVASLLPFGLGALRDTVTTSRRNLVTRALESDVLSANLLAGSLQRELDDRLNELLSIAAEDSVRQIIQKEAELPLLERRELFAQLDRKKRQVDQRRQALGRSTDSSWFLLDPEGYQRWRNPSSGTIDRNWACRDYFHGRGDVLQNRGEDTPDDQCSDLSPTLRPHVSAPYSSRTSGDWKVALSVPVFDRDEDDAGSRKIIGVLARSLNLSSLLKDYQHSLSAQGTARVGRQLAIVDGRNGIVLAHPWLTDERLERVDQIDKQLHLEGAIANNLETLVTADPEADDLENNDRTDHYSDPVASLAPAEYGGEWMAAFAPIGQTGWVAVVQERRQPVVEPVENLRDRLLTSGGLGLLMICGLVVGCWSMILLLISDRRPEWLRWWWRRLASTREMSTESTGRISESA